jgi:hypothetical protein
MTAIKNGAAWQDKELADQGASSPIRVEGRHDDRAGRRKLQAGARQGAGQFSQVGQGHLGQALLAL